MLVDVLGWSPNALFMVSPLAIRASILTNSVGGRFRPQGQVAPVQLKMIFFCGLRTKTARIHGPVSVSEEESYVEAFTDSLAEHPQECLEVFVHELKPSDIGTPLPKLVNMRADSEWTRVPKHGQLEAVVILSCRYVDALRCARSEGLRVHKKKDGTGKNRLETVCYRVTGDEYTWYAARHVFVVVRYLVVFVCARAIAPLRRRPALLRAWVIKHVLH